MEHHVAIGPNTAEFSLARPLAERRRPAKGDRRLGLVLALAVALVAMVVGLAQWQHGASVAPDDVASVLFQNG